MRIILPVSISTTAILMITTTGKAFNWAVFAGAAGHTYGCHPMWQFARRERKPFSSCRRIWQEALHLPGSGQMQHGRHLVESRPYFSRIPDQSLITSEIGEGTHHLQATRDSDGTYAFIYVPSPKEFTVHTGKLTARNLVASWYDPRTGKAEKFDEFANTGSKIVHNARTRSRLGFGSGRLQQKLFCSGQEIALNLLQIESRTYDGTESNWATLVDSDGC